MCERKVVVSGRVSSNQYLGGLGTKILLHAPEPCSGFSLMTRRLGDEQ